MKNNKQAIGFLILFLLSSSILKAQWQEVNCFPRGNVNSILSTGKKMLMLSTQGDLFISTDSGDDFSQIYFENESHYFKKINLVNDTLIAIVNGNRLGYSADYGKNWKYIHYNISGTISGVDKINDKFIILTENNRIYLSVDLDSTWKEISGSFEFFSNSSLKVLGNNILISNYCSNAQIYAIYLTSDYGNTWKNVGPFYIAQTVTNGSIALGITVGGVMRSSDNGLTWEMANNGLPNLIGSSITMSNNSIYIFGNLFDVFKSSDNGSNWALAIGIPTRGFELSATDKYLFYVYSGSLYKTSIAALTEVNKNDKQNDMSYGLAQNYPNPFNPSTTISFSIPNESHVTLKIYDVLGREVATLVNGNFKAGGYTKTWNATSVSSGIYFYRLEAGNYSETKKLNLIK